MLRRDGRWGDGAKAERVGWSRALLFCLISSANNESVSHPLPDLGHAGSPTDTDRSGSQPRQWG